MLLLSSTFSPIFFFKKCLSGTLSGCRTVWVHAIRVSNGLDPDQDRRCVGPDLGSNCLQRISVDEKKSPPAGKEFNEPVHESLVQITYGFKVTI